jgi:hypothetical protein
MAEIYDQEDMAGTLDATEFFIENDDVVEPPQFFIQNADTMEVPGFFIETDTLESENDE